MRGGVFQASAGQRQINCDRQPVPQRWCVFRCPPARHEWRLTLALAAPWHDKRGRSAARPVRRNRRWLPDRHSAGARRIRDDRSAADPSPAEGRSHPSRVQATAQSGIELDAVEGPRARPRRARVLPIPRCRSPWHSRTVPPGEGAPRTYFAHAACVGFGSRLQAPRRSTLSAGIGQLQVQLLEILQRRRAHGSSGAECRTALAAGRPE